MWLFILKAPTLLTSHPFPYLGVGQSRGKAPGERGVGMWPPGHAAGPGLGEEPDMSGDEGCLRTPRLRVGSRGGQAVAGSRCPLAVSGPIQERGLQVLLLGSQKLILAVRGFSSLASVCTGLGGIEQAVAWFQTPPKVRHPTTPPSATLQLVCLKCPVW